MSKYNGPTDIKPFLGLIFIFCFMVAVLSHVYVFSNQPNSFFEAATISDRVNSVYYYSSWLFAYLLIAIYSIKNWK